LPMAVVAGCYVAFAEEDSLLSSRGLLLASGWLGLWALLDFLPTPLALNLGRAAVDNFIVAAQTPRHYAEVMQESNCQAAARRRSEQQAQQLAELQQGSPFGGPPPLPDRDDDADDDDGGPASGHTDDTNDAQADRFGGEPNQTADVAVSGQPQESEDEDEIVADFQPSPMVAPLQPAAGPPAPPRSCCLTCCCLATVAGCGLGFYFWAVIRLLEMPLGRQVVWSTAVLGASYWGVTLVMQLLSILLGPRHGTLKRGEDGFLMVRSLTAEERQRFAAAAQHGQQQV